MSDRDDPEDLIRALSERRGEDADVMQRAIEMIVRSRHEFIKQQEIIELQNSIIERQQRLLGMEPPPRIRLVRPN